MTPLPYSSASANPMPMKLTLASPPQPFPNPPVRDLAFYRSAAIPNRTIARSPDHINAAILATHEAGFNKPSTKSCYCDR